MEDLITTSGVCRMCGGKKIKNIDGRRLSRERLEERHADVCPGMMRSKNSKRSSSEQDTG